MLQWEESQHFDAADEVQRVNEAAWHLMLRLEPEAGYMYVASHAFCTCSRPVVRGVMTRVLTFDGRVEVHAICLGLKG